MLRELLLGLLGFPGDLFVSNDSEQCMKLRGDIDVLTNGERNQFTLLSPLGWYYLRLQAFVNLYDIKYEKSAPLTDPVNSNETVFQAGQHLYRTSMMKGIESLLNEYVNDISYLDMLVVKEGAIPLSSIINHLKRYLTSMPIVYKLVQDVDVKNIRGCQLLDYLINYKTGKNTHTHSHRCFSLITATLTLTLTLTMIGVLT